MTACAGGLTCRQHRTTGPAVVARNLRYSSATSRSGTATWSAPLLRHNRQGVERPPPAGRAPARSAPAAYDRTQSPPATNGCRSARAQAAVSAALPRVVVALRPIVTRAARGSGSTPARCASSGNSAPPPMPDSSSRSARPSAKQAQRRLDPLRPAGEGHDAVGVRRRVARPVRQVHEPGKAGRARPARARTATPSPAARPAQQAAVMAAASASAAPWPGR